MPTKNLTRNDAAGNQVEFKTIGQTITLSENLIDRWGKIPTPPAMTETDAKTLTMLEQRLSLAKDRHLKRMDVWNNSYLQYRSVNYYSQLYGGYPSYWNAWGVNAFIPRTFETIETMRAQLKSREPDFSLEPQGVKETAYSEGFTNLMKSEWRRSDSQAEAVEALDDALLWGSGIVQNDLIHEVADENTISFDADGNMKYTLETVGKYYGIGCRRRDPYDVLPEPLPDATKINGRRNKSRGINWMFIREILDVEDVREQYKNMYEMGKSDDYEERGDLNSGTFGVTDYWKYLRPGGDLQDYKYLRTYLDDLYQTRNDIRYPATVTSMLPGATHKQTTEFAYQEGKIEVWHYFEPDRWITFTQGGILRDTPNPYPHKELPFSKMSLFNTKTFWDMGMPEVMKWLQVVENTLYDQGLNNIVMNVHKMFAVNSRYLEDEGELVVRPFGIVHLKNMPGVSVQDAIQPITFTPLFQDFFNFLTLNKTNLDSLTGTSDISKGAQNEKSDPETLGQSKMAAAGSTMRINEIARHFEQDLIADSVEQLSQIAQLYYQVDLGGQDGLDIKTQSGSQTNYYRFIPKQLHDVQATDMQIYTEKYGYKGIITFDQIQGKYRCTVKGGSSISTDPEDDARLKLSFANWAKNLVDPATIQGYDKKGNPIGAPVFDIVKLGMEVAKDVFKIPNAEDFRYKPAPPAQPGMQPGQDPNQPPTAPGQGTGELPGAEPEQLNNGAEPAPQPAEPIPADINQGQ